jgi:hypothetical protein
MSTYLLFDTVGCLNNDRAVMSKALVWRPLALLPILKASACSETAKDWLVNRRLDLYHRSMDHVIADLNELCSKDMYIRFADNRIRLSRAFYHVLVLDGAEIAAATMCDTRQCPVCTCPHGELDRTDVAYPYRHTEEVKAKAEAARREHLDDEGRVKDRHQSKVSRNAIGCRIRYRIRHRIRYIVLNIVYDIVYDVVYNVVYDIVCLLLFLHRFSRSSGDSSTS